MLSPWAGTVISPGDVTVYATLCALATLERGEVKRRVVEGEGMPGEGEGMKEIVDAWMGSRFKSVLELLEKYSVCLSLATLPYILGSSISFIGPPLA